MTRTKPRANANMPNNFVSVLDYGADPTGTNSSTQAVKDAFTAAAAKGGDYVMFPTGTYLIDETIAANSISFGGMFNNGPRVYTKAEGAVIQAADSFSGDTLFTQVSSCTSLTLVGSPNCPYGLKIINYARIYENVIRSNSISQVIILIIISGHLKMIVVTLTVNTFQRLMLL